MARSFEHYRAEEIGHYLAKCPVNRPIRAVVMHHTAVPSQAGWRGEPTMQAIWRYDTQQRPEKMRDIAADFYIAPDGLIWVGRPLSDPRGAHAYIQVSPVPDWAKGDRQWLNKHAVGIEHVGNFDGPERLTEPQRLASLALLRGLMQRFGPLQLVFHREVSPKSCPGRYFPSKADWQQWLAQPSEPVAGSHATDRPGTAMEPISLWLDGQPVGQGWLIEGRAWVPASLFRQAGWQVEWDGAARSVRIRSAR